MEKHSRKALQQITPYVPGKSIQEAVSEFGVSDVIKLASNENPLGCPVSFKQLEETVSNAHLYPHQASSPLFDLISKKHGLSIENVILGNGSDEIIQMISACFVGPHQEVITSRHTFSVYSHVTHIFDGKLIQVPMRNLFYNLDDILKAITKQSKVIFIANPNNPTGTFFNRKELEAFISKVPERVIVAIDEAYQEYVDENDDTSFSHWFYNYPNVVVLRTFSKLYGLAGLRIGYGLGSPTIIGLLNKVRPPFNVNSVAIKAAELAIQNKRFINESLKINREGKKYLYKELTKLKLKFQKTQANFIFITLPIVGKEAMDALLKEGVIVRALESFGLENAIRVTVGLSSQNERFILALKKVLEGFLHE